ncbi:hypothetical protein CASFOL_013632 [Castilleja foliolosa]|uniref:DUF7138 domain-containing protein n=1 Tax=Castilleja foliolosa TaxID=1961234 RepID=A0ABD3DMC9_9LAMI
MVPVVLFNGETQREMNIGDVELNPTPEYKPFQILLSRKMKISPDQISIHLLRSKPNPQPTDYNRRRNGKVDFGLICRHKGQIFLVVIKRYRRSSKTIRGIADFFSSERYLSLPARIRLTPESIVFIRRNHQWVELSDYFVARFFSLPEEMRVMPKNIVITGRYQVPLYKIGINLPRNSTRTKTVVPMLRR